MSLHDVIDHLADGETAEEVAGLARAIVAVLGGNLSALARDEFAEEWREAIGNDIGAAVGLVPAGWTWGVVVHPDLCNAWVAPPNREGPAVSAPVSPARALLLALLRAHAAAADAVPETAAADATTKGDQA